MSKDKFNRLNLYDYFGFPDRQKREEVQQLCDINQLRLFPVENNELLIYNIYFEQYSVWRNHISNYSSRLWLRFLLLYYQYSENPLDIISLDKYQSPEGAHKLLFDTFAEDVALYLVSYFDKHLEMFNDLYDLKQLSGKKYKLSRTAIITEMKKIEELKELANQYQNVEQSTDFRQIRRIRNNFVHNKSSSHYGMDITKSTNGTYSSGNSRGISTESTYRTICDLLRRYEQLCVQVNAFIKAKIEVSKDEI